MSRLHTPVTIVLVANTSWYLYNFRRLLFQDLVDAGFLVKLVAPHDEYTPLLESQGFKVYHWRVTRSSINPFKELFSLFHLWSIYREIRPDIVHHFTIKACLYGTIAAKGARIYRVVNSITGLGHVFVGKRLTTGLLRYSLKPLYSAIFKARRSTVVFQNADDQEQLLKLGIADSSRARLIRGSGVDISYFNPTLDNSGKFSSPTTILFPSRLIAEKGVTELFQACNLLWQQGFAFKLLVAGASDPGNRSSLSSSQLHPSPGDDRIVFLGHVQDMRSLYAQSDIVVLPSWREGLSRTLIEAASMERPIITTDVPGCRDVVEHGVTGLLVPVHDHHSLTLAIRLFLANPQLARQCGLAARSKVQAEFGVEIVNRATIKQYHTLLQPR